MTEHVCHHARLITRKPYHCLTCWQVIQLHGNTLASAKYAKVVVSLLEIFMLSKQDPRPLLEAKALYYRALGFNPAHDRGDIEHLKMPTFVIPGNNNHRKPHDCLCTSKIKKEPMFIQHYQIRRDHLKSELALRKAEVEASLQGSNGRKKSKVLRALEELRREKNRKLRESVSRSSSETSEVMLGKRKFKIEKEWLKNFIVLQLKYKNGKILKKRTDELEQIQLNYKNLEFKKTK